MKNKNSKENSHDWQSNREVYKVYSEDAICNVPFQLIIQYQDSKTSWCILQEHKDAQKCSGIGFIP